jgi:AcrR family transcriptional regulator
MNTYERARNRTQNSILEATLDLITEIGYEQVSITRIAERADIGRGTFYRYFESVDAVLLHIMGQINQTIYEEVAHILNSYESPEREQRAWIAAFIRLEQLLPLFRTFHGKESIALWENIAIQNLAGFTQSLMQNNILYSQWMDLPIDVMAHFTSGAILSLLRAWFAGDLRYSGQAMGQMVFKLLYHPAA